MKAKMKKKNVILVDFDKQEEFGLDQKLQEYSSEEWVVEHYTNNYFPRFLRQLTYFVFSFHVFLRLRKYEKIVAWQQFFGIALAFYCRLFRVKRERFITVMTFIYKPKNGFAGKLYNRFVRYAVESKYVKQVICYSRNEVEHYSKMFHQNFVFCPLGIQDCCKDFRVSHKLPTADKKGFFLACGRSNRDYAFLMDAFRDSDYQLRIICDELNEKSSANVRIYNHVKGKRYYEMLARCYGVIIPLKDRIISSGQLVLLEAMMFGKPIVVTQTEGLKDYINEDICIIDDNTKEELTHAIEGLMDRENYRKLSENLREDFLQSFTREKTFAELCEIIYS